MDKRNTISGKNTCRVHLYYAGYAGLCACQIFYSDCTFGTQTHTSIRSFRMCVET